jgi:hypothetical protein
MGANDKVAATFHGATPHERAITAVRSIRDANGYEDFELMYTAGYNDALREVNERINQILGD